MKLIITALLVAGIVMVMVALFAGAPRTAAKPSCEVGNGMGPDCEWNYVYPGGNLREAT